MASMGGNSIWFVPWGHKKNNTCWGVDRALLKKELVKANINLLKVDAESAVILFVPYSGSFQICSYMCLFVGYCWTTRTQRESGKLMMMI